MELLRPRFVFRDEIFVARPDRGSKVRFAGLWVAGTLAGLAGPTVAVVGPRAPSAGGIARARDLAATLASASVCIVSGLALGIDGAAHAGALAGGGSTIGVLGGGHRHFFPKRNRELAERMIASGGAVLSPYAPDDPARPPQFPQRNGVVAALADAVVVVEAAERSGALNTAGWAANLGIDVLVFPGDVDRPIAAGCNALIRDGATLVRHAGDVFDALGYRAQPPASATAQRTASQPEDPMQKVVASALATGPLDVDGLVAITGSDPGCVLAALVQLEVAGAIERREGFGFALVR